MIDFEYVLEEINSKLPDNNAQLITASKLRTVLEEMLILLEQQTGDFVFVDEDGLYITDELGYILSSFTDDGFDAAKFAPHLINYLKEVLNVDNFIDVLEDGLFIADENGYILASFTSSGFNAVKFDQNLITYLNNTLNIGTSGIVNVLQDGLFITDENGYVLASFTSSGFNCATIDPNLINLLKSLIITEKWTKISNTQYIISI